MSASILRKERMLSQADMTPARFLSEVVPSHDGDACLEWPFSKSGGGYGKIGRRGKTLDVHRLICREEHGEPPSPKHDAAHDCGNRACCNPRHLRWDTRKGNLADKKKHGTLLYGERHCMAKLSEAEVLAIRALSGSMLYREIGERFGIGRIQVGRIIHRRQWSHV